MHRCIFFFISLWVAAYGANAQELKGKGPTLPPSASTTPDITPEKCKSVCETGLQSVLKTDQDKLLFQACVIKKMCLVNKPQFPIPVARSPQDSPVKVLQRLIYSFSGGRA